MILVQHLAKLLGLPNETISATVHLAVGTLVTVDTKMFAPGSLEDTVEKTFAIVSIEEAQMVLDITRGDSIVVPRGHYERLLSLAKRIDDDL